MTITSSTSTFTIPNTSSTFTSSSTSTSITTSSIGSTSTTSSTRTTSGRASTVPSPSSLIASASETTNSTTPTPSGEARQLPTSPKHSISAGVIAGAVIGSLLVLAAGIGIFIIDHISPLEQEMTRDYELDALNVNIGPPSSSSSLPEKGSQIEIPQAEVKSIFISENSGNSESNFRSSLSGSPLLPLSTQNPDNVNDVRVQMGRMEATIGRMAEHMHRLESQLDWAGDGHSDAPPPTYGYFME
ncbi:hypothetical protein BDP27DRAFT_1367447 [Rhodocollybia butyracea]|uniref:Uncharacterized protein n=1 Tax=Rhodocollybia butyracea TaxID=206335 RepID=A0A9P5U344_9AGAR|nr:hypothetical protein BDP27DRAFT_1367447 [Rhodocollybia butyracea]